MTVLRFCVRAALTSIRGEMQYRANFILSVVFGLLFQTIGFVSVAVILSRFDEVGGWSLWEVAFLYGLRLSAHGLWLVSGNQISRFDQMIQHGEWDRYLLRPVPLWAQLVCINFRLPPFADMLSGIALLIVAANKIDISLDAARFAFLVLAIASGAMIDGGLQVLAASFAFRHLESMPIRVILDDFQWRFGSYPLDIFRAPIRLSLTWIVPVAFMAWIPASLLLGKPLPFPDILGWLTPVVGVIVWSIALTVFRAQSRHYASTGH